ncbi:MAG: hypothetical protein ACTS27_08680 [Phycisphaerales bacterium]
MKCRLDVAVLAAVAALPVSALAGQAPALQCPYTDTLDWLSEGSLADVATERWSVIVPANPEVLEQGIFGNVTLAIREQNSAGDNVYRAQFESVLPSVQPGVNEEAVFTAEVRTTGPGTTRGVALFSGSNLVARLFLGYRDADTGSFRRNVLVQTDPSFDPFSAPAIAPGAAIADTGYVLPDTPNVYHALALRVSSTGALTLIVDPAVGATSTIFIGDALSLGGFDRVVFESANDAAGVATRFYVDSVEALCAQSVFCPGDAAHDGVVNFTDLNDVLTNFGQSAQGIDGDANGDNAVDFADLNAVLSAFGADCFAN